FRGLVSGLYHGTSGTAWIPSKEVIAEQMRKLAGKPAEPAKEQPGVTYRDRQGNVIPPTDAPQRQSGLPGGSLPKKVLGVAGDVADASRALITAFDLSSTARQGAVFTFAHPIKATRALVDAIKSFASEKTADKVMAEIRSRPNAALYEAAGMYLSDRSNLSSQEESFIG